VQLTWPWLPVIAVTGSAVLGLLLLAQSRRARRPRGSDRPVAHLRQLREAPVYRRAIRSYRGTLAMAIALSLALIGVCAVTAARPIGSTIVTPETRNRDIVLCLDVSTSMTASTARVIESFDRLATEFRGERLALVLFDGSPLQVFPLTTDYGYVRAQLDLVRADLRGEESVFDHRSGTRVGSGSSRIGDGLAGCLLQFDRLDDARSRTVVLATDYQAVSDPLVTEADAVRIATERGVSVFGLNARHRSGHQASVDFERDVLATGGAYFPTSSADDSATAVRFVVDSVLSDPATVVVQSPVRTVTDRPDLPIWLLSGFSVALLALLWRLRL
jgi:Ca-activated chloride channel family protein